MVTRSILKSTVTELKIQKKTQCRCLYILVPAHHISRMAIIGDLEHFSTIITKIPQSEAFNNFFYRFYDFNVNQ